MKTIYLLVLLFVFSHIGFCETIQIQTIDSMPGFEKVGGPAFGESVKSYSGQGLVQYVSDSKIIINSKMFLIDKDCKDKIVSGQIKKAYIVTYELNKQARIKDIVCVVQLAVTGKIDRIDGEAVVVNDHYYPLDLFITYHDIDGHNIGHYDIEKGDFVGLALKKEGNVSELWYLNGHYMY
jgi:hypothetical protein